MCELERLWLRKKELTDWERTGLNPRLRPLWLKHRHDLRRQMKLPLPRPAAPVHRGAVSLADILGGK